jgi:hypothetical protein
MFVVSDMVIENLRMPRGADVLAFNGTTEWAMDSVGGVGGAVAPRARTSCARLSARRSWRSSTIPGETPGTRVTP